MLRHILAYFIIAFALSAGSPGFAESWDSGKFAIVGLDGARRSATKPLSIADYQNCLGTAISKIQGSLLPILRSRLENNIAGPNRWNIRTLGVGIGIESQATINPVFSVTATPHVRLIYTNSTAPVYPD